MAKVRTAKKGASARPKGKKSSAVKSKGKKIHSAKSKGKKSSVVRSKGKKTRPARSKGKKSSLLHVQPASTPQPAFISQSPPMHFVYVLQGTRTNKWVIGVARDPKRVLQQMNTAKKGTPFELAYSERYGEKNLAAKREKFFKTREGEMFLKNMMS